MSYFGETPSVENELKKLRKELNQIKVQAEFQPVTQVGHSTGEGVGGGTTSISNDHLFKLQPVVHNIKRKVTDKEGNSKSGNFNKIFLTSSCVLVDKGLSTDTVGGGAHSPTNYQLELMTIQGAIGQDADSDTSNVTTKMHDGQIVYIKPRSIYDNSNGNRLGYSLTLKAKTSTEGNIDIAEDVTINSDEFAILQWHEDAHATNGHGYFLLLRGGSSNSGSNTIKQPCRVATTGNNALHPAYNVTIDGVTLVEGDRLLIKNQTTQRDNGIYVCGSVVLGSATFTRVGDFDNDSEVKSGVLVAVNEGTINGNTLWALTSDGSLTVGTSDLVFTKMTIDSSLDYTWSGKHLYNNATTWLGSWDTDAEKQAGCQVKFQGDGLEHKTSGNWDSGYSDASTQRVLEIGKYGSHEVKIIAEVTGEGDAIITDPDGSGYYTIPDSDPSISFKSSIVMNTYTMYDLDTLVFSQGDSTTTPPPLDSWVYIEANTGTSGSPNLTGMHYNVPTSKTHQFKVNGTEKLNISSDGMKLLGNSTPSSLSNGMMWLNSSDNKVYVRSNGATSELGSGGVALDDDPIWSGKHVWDNATTWSENYDTDSEKATNCHAKFQGDGLEHSDYDYTDASANPTQRVLEIGKYGTHEVKIIAEVTGEGDAEITDPDGTGTYTIPNSDPSISMKASLVMNTYTMYDLDTLVFSQGASTTTPAPLADWVWIEANTGTSGSPSLTGMHYNVPTSKTHQFKINLAEKFNISSDGIKLSSNSTPSSPSNGMIWLDSGDNKVYARSNGASVEVGGSGGGSWVGTATSQLNMGAHSIKGAWGGTANTLGVQSDLDMNTYDINDADRIKFSTTQGTGSSLGSSDYGIETAYNSGTAYGMSFRVPASTFFYFNSGSSQILFGDTTGLVTGESILGGSLKTSSFVDFDNISSPSNPATNHVKLFADSDNSDHLTVRKSNGSEVDLEAGGGGVGLGDNNVWTGTNKFTQHVTLGNGDNLLPEVDVGSDLGDSTHAFSLVYFRNLFLDDPNIWIKYVSGDMVLNTKSGNDIIFKENDETFFFLDGGNNDVRFSKEVEFNADVRMDGGNVFRSQNGVEIGYYVTDTTASTGVQGTQQLPYWESTSIIPSQQSSSTLDSKFGNQTGCSGIQYDSSENAGSGKYRLWIKTEGSGTSQGKWVKTELS